MSEPGKIYVPASVQEISERLTKFSFKAEAMLEFIRQHANERGYVNLCISPRKAVGKYGETHTCWLDTWKPDPSKARAPKPQQPGARPDDDDQPPF